MKILLLCLGMLAFHSTATASDLIDTTITPIVIQLAKVSKKHSNTKYWILYHNPTDLVELESKGYTILKTKNKMIRNNQFWLDLWQSSLQMAVGHIVAKNGKKESALALPNEGNEFQKHFLPRDQY